MSRRGQLKTWGLDYYGDDWWGQGLCRDYPDLWTVDHAGGHANCVHGLARHICLNHCPVLEQCAREVEARPKLYGDTVMGGQLWISHNSVTAPAAHQPDAKTCDMCWPGRRDHTTVMAPRRRLP